jgi:hypothetical protein
MPEIPFCEKAFHPQYKTLAKCVGVAKLGADKWPEWARIIALHGWDRVLRAAEDLDPKKRWPPEIEALCRQFQWERDQEEREAKAREVRDTPVQRSPDEVRYATWASYYSQTRVSAPQWFRDLAQRLGKTGEG